MKTQQDSRIRMVALDNLRAMCARASGVCHRYTVSKVSRSRVHVTYSNPDEYGNDRDAVTAVFPCYPSVWAQDTDNPRVVLDPIRVTGGRDEHDQASAYQSIDAAIVSGPTVWRMGGEEWLSHASMLQAQRSSAPVAPGTKCPSCTVCDAEVRP